MFDVLIVHKSVDFDSARGILAAKQYEVSKSPDLLTLALASPDDLTQHIYRPEVWRAPGYQAVPYWVHSFGLAWEYSLRVVVSLALLIGLVGWFLYFREALNDLTQSLVCTGMLICLPYISKNIYTYDSGDLLLWAGMPWVFVVNIAAYRRRDCSTGFAMLFFAGLLTVSTYFLKYSAAFLAVGIGIWWLWEGFRKRVAIAHVTLFGVGCVVAFLAIVWVGLIGSGANPGSSIGENFRWGDAVLALGVLPVAITGISEAFYQVAREFGVDSYVAKTILVPALGLVLLIVAALFLALRSNNTSVVQSLKSRCLGSSAIRLAAVVVLSDVILYTGIIFLGGSVDVSARLVRVSAVLCLPLIVMMLWEGRRAIRRPLTLMVVALFLIPILVLGPYRLYLASTTAIEYVGASSEGVIRNARLSRSALTPAFVQELKRKLPSRDTTLYVTAPEYAFGVPECSLLLQYVTDKEWSADSLSRLEYRNIPEGGVAVLLNEEAEKEGRKEAILGSFKDVIGWTHRKFASAPELTLWLSVGD